MVLSVDEKRLVSIADPPSPSSRSDAPDAARAITGNSEAEEPHQSSRSMSELGPPRLPERTAGRGWVCMKSASFENMSSCFRTAAQCTAMRAKLTDQSAGMRYGPCLPQPRAACFTFRNNLQDSES